MPRIRALLIAEAANPEWSSVPLVGWSHAKAITELAHTHIVTQIRNKDAIERTGWCDGKEFTAIDSERVSRPLFLLGKIIPGNWTTKMAVNAFSYYYFERLVWQRFAERIRSGEFDVVHRLTPLSPTVPSLLASKCKQAGTPFVLGPLNGGVPWPKHFGDTRRREREWLSYVRDAYKLMPGYHSTRRDAAAIIIASQHTWQQIPHKYHDKCVYIPENAVDTERFKFKAEGPVKLPLRIAFVGRLVPYKGVDMLVEACAPLIRDGKVVLDIIGDGPEMNRLQDLIERNELSPGVTLTGWIDHKDLQKRLPKSDVFAFPSIREFGGGVVLEAMLLGMVPVVVDYAGPAELVTERTGYKVPIDRREKLIQSFREVIARLAENPDQIREMGQHARERVMTSFTWSAKAKQTLEVYKWVTGKQSEKPDFGMPLPDAAYDE